MTHNTRIRTTTQAKKSSLATAGRKEGKKKTTTTTKRTGKVPVYLDYLDFDRGNKKEETTASRTTAQHPSKGTRGFMTDTKKSADKRGRAAAKVERQAPPTPI